MASVASSSGSGTEPGKQRREASVTSFVSDLDADEELGVESDPESHVPTTSGVCAPRMNERNYESWPDFFSALAEYQDTTYQVFKKRTSTSAATRNAEMQKQGTLTDRTKIPLAFKKYYYRLCCTHGWSRASRAKGKRKNYFQKSTKCEAQLSVTVVWTSAVGFCVKITQQNTSHNHPLASTVYTNHPVNRRIADASVIKTQSAETTEAEGKTTTKG